MARKKPKAVQLAELCGRFGYWIVPDSKPIEGKKGMLVKIVIEDARSHFGRDEVLVRPTDGEGKRWMNLAHVEVLP